MTVPTTESLEVQNSHEGENTIEEVNSNEGSPNFEKIKRDLKQGCRVTMLETGQGWGRSQSSVAVKLRNGDNIFMV